MMEYFYNNKESIKFCKWVLSPQPNLALTILFMLLTLGTDSSLHIRSSIRSFRISQANIQTLEIKTPSFEKHMLYTSFLKFAICGCFLLCFNIEFTTSGFATFGFEPPIVPG